MEESHLGMNSFGEKYLINFATKEDIPHLVRMRISLQEHMEQTNSLILRYTDKWRNELPSLFKELLNNSNVLVIKAVSKRDSEVVGMMVGTINEHLQFTIQRSVKIDDVWVDENHRQQGICSKMLSNLLNRLTKKQITHFTLNYVANNIEAEQTWRALGFTPTIMTSVAKIKH